MRRLQNPWLLHELGEIKLATSRQWIVRSRRHYQGIVEERYDMQILVIRRVQPSQDHVAFSTAQRRQRHRGSDHIVNVKHNVRIDRSKLANDIWKDRCRDGIVALKLYFATSWIR